MYLLCIFQSLIPTRYSKHFSVEAQDQDSSSPRGDSQAKEVDSPADSPFNLVDIKDQIRTLHFVVI